MKLRLASLLCCLLSCLPPALRAQVSNQYHLDLYNGLPSNLLYGIVLDNYGYLWICTDKGLTRYNGYAIKTYTTDDGLPSNDVWGLYRDRKNRLWLCTVCNRVGYISNGKYKDAYLVHNPGSFYINNIRSYEGGIRFFSGRADTPGSKTRVLYIERNDTIRPSGIYDNGNELLDEDDNMFERAGDKIRMLHINADGSTRVIYSCNYDHAGDAGQNGYTLFHTYFCRYKRFTNEVKVLDIKTGMDRKIYFRDATGKPDPISMLPGDNKGGVLALTRQAISILDSDLHIRKKYPIHTLINDTGKINGSRLSGFIEDTFWGKCIATQTSGLYINYGTEQYFNQLISADMSDYIWIGNADGDTASYWWSYKARSLLTVGEQGQTERQRYDDIFDAVRMAPYNRDTSLLVEKGGPFYYIHHNKKVITASRAHQYFPPGHKGNNWDQLGTIYTRDLSVAAPGHFYIAGNGLLDCTLQNDSIAAAIIDGSRYNHLLYDSTRNIYWAYYNDRMLLYNPESGIKITASSILQQLGIPNVEQLAIDPLSGSIYLKDHTRLLVIDPVKGTMTSLFKNYNLKDAMFCLGANRLILAGKFGILFSDIRNGTQTGKPVLFSNIKNSHYFQVLDMAIMHTTLLLKTDKGTYRITLPPPGTANGDPQLPAHKIIIQYNDTLHNVIPGKKLNITTASDKLLLDVVSPQGNGTVHYKYSIGELGNDWHELNSNELKLPLLEPGKSYHMLLAANDDVWVSDEIPVTLYMVPEWWQTPGWSVAISACILLLIVLILLSVILVTRYFVKKAANRKQVLNTLELRAIHAQINPHFIFNTLNTALYFIKKEKTEEAATHVSRFSRLLRGYLESSHQRYISIANEITSLKNYIELQQTRFEDVFTYEIIVHDDLQTEIVFIPSLLLQPLVENAINHGLAPSRKGGHLSVIFSRDETGAGIICIVDDNGIGRRQAAEYSRNNELKRESHGSRLTEELIDVFNRYERMGIGIVYIDKEPPQTGTRVKITIKNPRYER